ncbi:hypothetical protein D9M72_450350 [compost metagenome]
MPRISVLAPKATFPSVKVRLPPTLISLKFQVMTPDDELLKVRFRMTLFVNVPVPPTVCGMMPSNVKIFVSTVPFERSIFPLFVKFLETTRLLPTVPANASRFPPVFTSKFPFTANVTAAAA